MVIVDGRLKRRVSREAIHPARLRLFDQCADEVLGAAGDFGVQVLRAG